MKIKKFQSKSNAQKHLSTKEKLNPFEVHINHSKHKILGQKSKDDHGLPGVSRGKAYRKREKTLLNEYNNRYKSGNFLDMRIGEKNRFLDPEKKIMMRLAAEKKRQFSKKSLFNLNDDEQLMHGGEVLNEVTMKDQSAFSDEDDDDGMIDADIVREQHFGGEMLTRKVENIGANNNTFTKSRKERIEEMIMASKKKKEETKKDKEIHQDAVSKLDAKFQQFLTLMKGKTMTDEDKERSKKTCEFKEYDMYVKELAFDRSKRARPTDRLKTEEELVREEKERLKKLEEDRQRRMRGEIQATQQSMMSADALDDCWEKPKMKKRDKEEDTDDGVKFGWNGYTKCDGSKAKSEDEETKDDSDQSGENESEDDSDQSGENESEDEEDSEVDENESEIDKNKDESVVHEENESDVSENEEGSKVDDEDNESKEDENDSVADEESESEIMENEAGSDVKDVDNESEEDKSEEFIVDENDCDISENEEESKVENEGNASEEDTNEDESVIDEGNESEIKDNEDGSEIEDEDNEPEVDEDGNECEDDESVVDEDGNECEIMENEDSSEVEDEDNEPGVDEDEENAFEISENEEGTKVEDEDNESDKDKNEDESVVSEENDVSEVEDEDNEPEVDKCEDDNSVVIEEGNECEIMENNESEVEDEDNEPEVDEDEDEENESELSENEESFEVEDQDGSEVEENENGKLILADNEENDGNSEDENDSEEYRDDETEAVEDEDNEYATGENEHEREDGSVVENEDSLSEVESKENSSEVDNDNDESQAGEDNEDECEVDENDDSVGNAENEYEDEDESAAVYENDGSAVEDSGNEAEGENENCNKSEVEENDSDSKGSESETERNEGNVSEESMSGIDENDTDVDEDKVEETESEIEGENDINQPNDSDESEAEHEHYDDKTQWKKSHNSKYDSEDQSDDLDSIQDLEKLSIKTRLENDKDLRIRNKNTKKKKKKSKVEEELPYTFEVPPEFDDFWELMQDRTPQQVSTIIERMITCNHPSLGADNKEKSNTIFAYLLQTLHIICGVDPESIKGDIHPLNYVDSLVPHLYTLTQLNPPDSGSAVSQVIDEKYEDCTKKDTYHHYPNGDTFIFLKLSGLLFPSSDYRHDVMTRVLTFLTQILGEARVKCGRDLVGLLFTASLLFEYLKRSCRFVAELTNALHAVLYFSIPATEAKLTLPHTHPFKATGPASDLLVLNQPCRTFSSPKLTFSLLNETVELSSDFKIKILNEALLLLNKVCQQWINLSAVRSIFSTTSKLLINLPLDNYPNDTKSLVQSLQTSISNLPRQVPHLVKPESKLRVLRMIDPAIEEVVEGVKKRGGNKQLQERNKLLHKIRRERKGAKRELKRDAEFLARQQLREVLQSDAERKRKVNMIMHGLETQESEYKKFKRSK